MAFNRELIEARLSLKLIANADMPNLALDALEAGIDGPAVRRLAALDKPTYFEVRDFLAKALDEMHLSTISPGDASLRIAKDLASKILESGDDPLKYTREFEKLWIRAGYPKQIQAIGTLNDEVYWRSGSEAENREYVCCKLRKLLE